MKHFKAYIKDYEISSILTPEYWGDNKNAEELAEFWGCYEPEVESFRIVEVIDGVEYERIANTN